MDPAPRVRPWLLVAFFVVGWLGLCTLSLAVPPCPIVYTACDSNGQNCGSGSSQSAACSGLAANMSGHHGNETDTYTFTTVSGGYCQGTEKTVYDPSTGCTGAACTTQGTAHSIGYVNGVQQDCGNTQCASSAGTHPKVTGDIGYSAGTGANPAFSDAICFNGCKYTGGSSGIQLAGSENGTWSVRADPNGFTGNGAQCPSSDAANGAPATCAKGTCPGSYTISGVTTQTCQACDSQQTSPVASTSQAASGGAVTTTSAVTTCTYAGTCTTVTTTTTGSTTTIGTTVLPQSNFCAANPSNKICTTTIGAGNGNSSGNGTGGGTGSGSGSSGAADQDGASFGGSCDATSCDGDAVQCAIAQEQYKRDCQFAQSFGDATTASGNAQVIAGNAAYTAGDKPTDHPGAAGNVTSVSMAAGFDQTDLIGGGGLADLTVAVGGHNLVLPFSQLQTPASYLGNILVGLTALTCLGIAFVRGSP